MDDYNNPRTTVAERPSKDLYIITLTNNPTTDWGNFSELSTPRIGVS